jgi:hypothetical protein
MSEDKNKITTLKRQIENYYHFHLQCEDAVAAALHFNGRRRRFTHITRGGPGGSMS